MSIFFNSLRPDFTELEAATKMLNNIMLAVLNVEASDHKNEITSFTPRSS